MFYLAISLSHFFYLSLSFSPSPSHFRVCVCVSFLCWCFAYDAVCIICRIFGWWEQDEPQPVIEDKLIRLMGKVSNFNEIVCYRFAIVLRASRASSQHIAYGNVLLILCMCVYLHMYVFGDGCVNELLLCETEDILNFLIKFGWFSGVAKPSSDGVFWLASVHFKWALHMKMWLSIVFTW